MAKTQVPDPGGDTSDGAGTGSGTGSDHPSGRSEWIRRGIITLALALCAAALFASYRVSDKGTSTKDADPTIVAQFPAPGSKEPRQTSVFVDLKPGYDGRLTINGIAIPEAEMDGARDPRTVSEEDLKANGLRPNNRNHVAFTPGPGKVIERFDAGTLRVSVQYFRDRRPEDPRTVSWTATVI